MIRCRRDALAWSLVLVAAWTLAGCRGPTGRTLKVDENQAKSALDWFFEQWKAGRPFDSVKNHTPPIIGADAEWQRGVKLVSYEYHDTSNDGANFHARVILKTTRIGVFEDQPPIEETQYAIYTVSTKPVLTVFREE